MGDEVTIEGITIYKRTPNEVIMPEDDNNKRAIILKLLDKMLRILEEVTS